MVGCWGRQDFSLAVDKAAAIAPQTDTGKPVGKRIDIAIHRTNSPAALAIDKSPRSSKTPLICIHPHRRQTQPKFKGAIELRFDQKRGKPLASDMGKDSAAVERSGAAN